MTDDSAAPASRNIRILLAYDGTQYLGWQVQPQGPTIQSMLQDALKRITGEQAAVKGSGRTDAGVHALGQVANFHTRSSLEPAAFVRAFNSVLPPAIAVLDADEVGAGFDAQFSAVGKHYRYRVLNNAVRSPFELHRSWHVNRSLDIESMSASSSILLGLQDYSSFRASGCAATHPLRTMTRCSVDKTGDIIVFDLEADGFLRHMVRNIVGTLIGVGNGRFSTADFAAILAARDRTRAGIAAPPQGLYLVQVHYPR